MNLLTAYLIHSYLYYELDTSLISDSEFDDICKSLLTNFPNDHIHANLVTLEALKASTGFGVVCPSIVKDSAIKYYFSYTNGYNPYNSEKLSIEDTMILHRKLAY